MFIVTGEDGQASGCGIVSEFLREPLEGAFRVEELNVQGFLNNPEVSNP